MNLKEATAEALCDRLAEGRSLVSVCRDKDMPSVRSVQIWISEDEAFAAQIMRAREAGYLIRGDRAVEEARAAPDAALGRLAFDAERWYLGKLSNAFSDNKDQKHKHSGADGGAIAVTIVTGVPRGDADD